MAEPAAAGISPRPPRNQVHPRARVYWLVIELGRLLGVAVAGAVLLVVTDASRAWVLVALGLVLLGMLGRVVVVPLLRYRTHRWEATATAVYAMQGWLSREWRVAPLSRVQTVEAARNPLHRMLGLSSVLVTTASSKGPILVDGLDRATADDLVAALTFATEQTRGDAT